VTPFPVSGTVQTLQSFDCSQLIRFEAGLLSHWIGLTAAKNSSAIDLELICLPLK
jgi:hypothetical protein